MKTIYVSLGIINNESEGYETEKESWTLVQELLLNGWIQQKRTNIEEPPAGKYVQVMVLKKP